MSERRSGRGPVAMRLAFVVLAACLVSCGLLVSFDEFDTSTTTVGRDTRFVVGGTVEGLGPDATVSLTLNAGAPITVGDGKFAFPEKLVDGAQFTAEITDAQGFACRISGGRGKVPTHDVEDIAVACLSTAVTLASLTVSAGALSPPFDPAVTSGYSAGPLRVPAIPDTTVTIVATSSVPGAVITLPGAAPAAGMIRALVAIRPGRTSIEIGVTSVDGKKQSRYVVDVSGIVTSDYLKSPSPLPVALGNAIAVSGDTVAVGAVEESSGGAVVVFRRTGVVWAQETYLKLDIQLRRAFGASLALAGDTLVVGAPEETNGAITKAGAVYVFTRSGSMWSSPVRLVASSPMADALFGSSLGLSGEDTIAVGAPNAAAGAVHLFTRSGGMWTELASALAPSAGGLRFGESVSLSGDALAVGGKAAAWTFAKTSGAWLQTHQFVVSNGSGILGVPVALSGETLAVGAPYADVSGSAEMESGAVFVFTRSGASWSEPTALRASTPRAYSYFGGAVALSGDFLVVGAVGEKSNAMGSGGDETDASLISAGAVYVLERTAKTWKKRVYLKASNTRTGAYFGSSVALGKDILAVGSTGESSNASGVNGDQTDTSLGRAGAAYVF